MPDVHSLTHILTSLASDWLIVGVVFLLVAIDSMRAGSGRAIAVALSFVFTTFIVSLIPHTAMLETLVAHISNGGIPLTLTFAGVLVASYVMIRRMTSSYGDMGGAILGALFSALATTLIFLAFWISTPALTSVWAFGPFFSTVFGGAYTLWWVAGSFVVLAVTRG